MTTKCSEDGCQSTVYDDKDKCVLHCAKNMDGDHYKGFLREQRSFCSALLGRIVEKLFDDGIDIIESLSFPNSTDSFKDGFLSEYRELKSQEDQKKYLKEYLKKTLFNNVKNPVKLKNGIYLENIHFPRVDIQSLHNYRRILDLLEDIHFDACEFYGTSLDHINGEVFFQDCIFWNGWQLQDFNIRKSDAGYVYNKCHFKEKITQTKGTVSNPQFDKSCTFDDGLEFKSVQIKANIFWISSEPEQDASYLGVMKGEFKFTDCTFSLNQEIYLANAEKASFVLERCKFEKKFKIRGLEYTDYEYQQDNKAALKSLKFNSCQIANNDDSYLRVGFLRDCEFSFKNFKNQASSELNIGDCHFKSFELTNFRNLGKFKLFKINIMDNESGSDIPNPSFKIDNTSIGNADFQSIDLTSFSKVFMFDNIFSEIDYTNVQWPSCISVDQFQGKKENEIAKKRDTYRTLKNVALKNNDRPQALSFYVQEMDYHCQATKWIPQFGDKLILMFNKLTNGFGLFWWLPLMQLLGVSLLFYCYLWTTLNMNCVVDYGSYWKYYWVFLNPTHKTEFVASGCWNGLTYFIDFLFRVIQVFLVYQTIQAFRKFTRPL